jgi:YidC/Oxa1 family membrane protein insertase
MGSDQKRMFLAMVLSGVILFAWQAYFVPQNSPVETKTKVEETAKTTNTNNTSTNSAATPTTSADALPVPTELTDLVLKGEKTSFHFKSNLALEDVSNSDAVFSFKSVVSEKAPFKVFVKLPGGDRELNLVGQASGRTYQGEDRSLGIVAKLMITDDGTLSLNLNSSTAYQYKFIINSSEKTLDNQQIREFLVLTSDVERSAVGESHQGDGSVKWFGVDFNFHLFSFIFKEKVVLKYWASEKGSFTVETVNPTNALNTRVVFLKKNYDDLDKLGDNLGLSIDFGFFGILSIPLLRGLQFIYGMLPNYGWAIVLLTFVVRLVLFPLQLKSIKSMKKMQKLQPELQKIKDKHKDDPQRVQKETMELFKKNGANPLGGCLPMLMQMPIFFAFYQVLYNAVELVGAPFVGWITDLSIKDPFYVLPVGMGVAMFFQQKLTPSTSVDPTQQKIMMFMPLIFCFFMKDLPAGLNLYILTSTLFGIAQQVVVYRVTD